MPRFTLMAIWPDFVLPNVPVQLPESVYSTPYLDVMQAAIMHFGLSAENQGKKARRRIGILGRTSFGLRSCGKRGSQ